MMHILRIILRSGAQIELLYRGIKEARAAAHLVDEGIVHRVSFADDFGKVAVVSADQIDAHILSDYTQELAGVLEIAWHKQQVNEAHQKRVAAQHGMIGMARPQIPNGMVIGG
jgi:arginyl-tRNA synthetase